MARVPKKKPRQVEVPTLEQDAAERKRLLNVLAQRRYRERKRQRYEDLESKVISDEAPVVEIHAPNNEDWTRLDDLDVAAFDGGVDWDTNVLFPSLQSNSSTSSPSDGSGGSYLSNNSTLTSTLTSTSTSTSTDGLSFPDEVYLPVLELNILKAGMTIAKRLDIDTILWDLSSLSPFNHYYSTNLTFDHLPVNLRPTFTQLTVPHHPIFDILPWPEVRDKLILVFSQPEELRPPTARSPTAMLGFAYDIEDTAEGIRVTGDDPYACQNWELGQKVFDRWWWAFTQEIVDHSNAVREARGATTLTGMIVGEVTS